jgi:SAM-dependent methyltransferase
VSSSQPADVSGPVTATSGADDALAEGFWGENQPAFRFSSAEIGSPAFFAEVEAHRYSLEPHIREIASFEDWSGRDVLDVGCGMATDGLQFARAGARYTGVDFSPRVVSLASQRFELEGCQGGFVQASASDLPFADDSFDLVFSHGVIHHLPATREAVEEFRRVLRPGGLAIVMVYHRNSLNYWINIMLVRRLFALALLLPGVPRLVALLTGETQRVASGHRQLFHRYGFGYLVDQQLFLSNNTDGPGNPLSKVFSRNEATSLFHGFSTASTKTRFLNLRIYPAGTWLGATRLARRLERRYGWHLYVLARK